MTTAQPEPITCYRCVELPVARATGNADANSSIWAEFSPETLDIV